MCMCLRAYVWFLSSKAVKSRKNEIERHTSYIYIYKIRSTMWTEIQTPAAPIGATAEKLVTRSNDSGSKSSKEVRASKIFWVLDISWLRHVWFVCGRLWENSDACSLLFNSNKTRRERFFLSNLRHHNHQRQPSATTTTTRFNWKNNHLKQELFFFLRLGESKSVGK